MSDWPSILAEHGPTVWRTIYRLLDHHADALDCYQETLLAAWRFAANCRTAITSWASVALASACWSVSPGGRQPDDVVVEVPRPAASVP